MYNNCNLTESEQKHLFSIISIDEKGYRWKGIVVFI
jgi:hypothetical protein